MVIRTQGAAGCTAVPNRFIDECMAGANGEFVKVYLLLLRLAEQGQVTDTQLADRLNMPERDVQRAVKYWTQAGVLPRQEESTPAEEDAGGAPQAAAADSPQLSGKSYTPTQIQTIRDSHEDFSMALFAVERYLKRTLSSRDLERFTYFYEDLHFPGSLIEYLVEHCVQCRKPDMPKMSYIEAVALEWHREGRLTVDAAREGNEEFSGLVGGLKKALGIRSRDFNDDEQAYIARWQADGALTSELICEAGRQAVSYGAKNIFPYMESVLQEWKSKGLGTVEQVKAECERYAAEKSQKPAEEKKAAAAGSSGRRKTGSQRKGQDDFDFKQRHFDYDAVLRREA